MNKIARLLVGINRPKSDSALYAWGYNSTSYPLTNILSLGITSNPTTIDSVSSWAQLSVGSDFVLGLKQDGTLWTWGDNTWGQLGRSDAATYTPTRITEHTWNAISAGDHFASAIRSDGKLFVWGRNSSGALASSSLTVHASSPVQITSVAGSWTSVSCGKSHVMALRNDGALYGWGDGKRGQVVPSNTATYTSPSNISGSWSAVASGGSHTAAISYSGLLFTWGSNADGQLGNSKTTSVSAVTQIGTTIWSNIAAGDKHTVATRASDGSLWVWGRNNEGQLGNATSLSASSPVQINSSNWSKIIAEGNTTAAIRQSDNTLWVWGTNYPALAWQYPVTSWQTVTSGEKVTAVIKPDGTLWVWGDNTYGQVGDNTTLKRSSPVQVGSTGWASVSVGKAHIVARKTTGTVWGWGDNTYGQLGDGTTISRSSPVQMGAVAFANSTIADVQAGGYHTMAVTDVSTMYGWGKNDNGQLGCDDRINKSQPTLVSGGIDWSNVECGYDFTIGVSVARQLFGWGNAYDGQIGPVAPVTPSEWLSLSGPRIGDHGVVHGIKTNGTMWTWGNTTSNTISSLFGTGNTQVTSYVIPQQISGSWAQVSSGDKHVVALKSDGSIWGWGNNTFGQVSGADPAQKTTPTLINGTSWSQVSAGEAFNLAIKDDGTIWGWGNSTDGKLLDANRAPASWAAVASGRAHNLALTADGRLFAWGNNSAGQLGTGETTTVVVPRVVKLGSWISIGATVDSSYAIKDDGTLWSWGDNSQGQLGQGSIISKSSPTQVGVVNTWSQVATGNNFAVVRSSTGTIWGMGQLTGTSEPTQIQANTKLGAATGSWTNVAVGHRSIYATSSDGSVWGLGNNVPVYFTPHSWTMIQTPSQAVGKAVTISGIKTDGTLWAWGYNEYGMMGVGNTTSPTQILTTNNLWISSPVQVGSDSWKMVSSGGTRLAGIKADGTMYQWGTDYSAPTQIGSLNTWSSVSVGSYVQSSNTGVNASITGSYTAHAIKADGSLWGWGVNASYYFNGITTTGTSSPAQMGSGSWSMVSTGAGYGAAIKADGTLWVWGDDRGTGRLGREGTVQFAAVDMRWKQIASNDVHGLGIDYLGRLHAWGDNTYGQLGNGTTEPRYHFPERVIGGSWTMVAVGNRCSFGLRTDGTVWVWGHNGAGDLGLNNTIHYSSPVQLGTSSWSVISAGGGSVGNTRAAGIVGGTLYGWGAFLVGDGTTAARSSPVQISAGMTDVSVGAQHTLSTNGTAVFAWGNNYYYQIGDNTNVSKSSPVMVFDNGGTIASISAGDWHSAVVFNPGYAANQAFTWGTNTYGQLGLGNRATATAPQQVNFNSNSTPRGVIAGRGYTGWLGAPYNSVYMVGNVLGTNYSSPIQVGAYHYNIARQNESAMRVVLQRNYFSGTYYAPLFVSSSLGSDFGPNQPANFTNPSVYSSLFSINVGGSVYGRMLQIPGSWTFVHAGVRNTFAIDINNKLWGWGYNADGEIGINNTITIIESPTQIGNNNWRYVTTGRGSGAYATAATGVMGYTTSNAMFAWGVINTGEGGALAKSSPVQVGSSTSWKANTGGVYVDSGNIASLGIMAVNTNDVLNVAGATYLYSAAANSDMAMWPIAEWPYGGSQSQFNGMLRTLTPSWTAVSAGKQHTVAIAANGTMWSWGSNNTYGILGWGNTSINYGLPAKIGTSSSWVAVSAGADITLATNKSGSNNQLYAWGYERQGILGTGTGLSYLSSPVQVSTDNWSSIAAFKNSSENITDSMISYGIKNDNLYATGNGYFGDNLVNTSFQTSNTFTFVTPVTLAVIDTPTQLMTGSWTSVSAGSKHAAAIRSDGKLFTWGKNDNGQLGDGTVVTRSSPVQIGTSSWSQVSAGYNTTLAIRTNGSLFGWGLNSSYELGTGNNTTRSSPVQVGTSSWSMISAGNKVTAGVTIDRNVYMMGTTSEGVLQTPSLYSNSSITFEKVYPAYNTNYSGLQSNTTGIYAIANTNHGSKLMGAGYVNIPTNIDPIYIGSSTLITLDGEYPGESLTPALISASSWTSVGAGYHHVIATTADGSLWGWGLNKDGQLGLDNRDSASSPTQIGTQSWTSVVAAANSSLARAANTLYTWGYSSANYNLGSGTTSRSSPVQIGSGISWTGGTIGNDHGAAISNAGVLHVWGNNSTGLAGRNDTVGPISAPVAVTALNATSLSSPTQIGSGSDWRQVAFGGSFAVGIRST